MPACPTSVLALAISAEPSPLAARLLVQAYALVVPPRARRAGEHDQPTEAVSQDHHPREQTG